MQTMLISNGLRTSRLNSRPSWRDTLYGVLLEHGGYIDGARDVYQWYWETPRIGMKFQDIGTMNGHSILGWILRLSAGCETHFYRCLAIHLWSISSLIQMEDQIRRWCTNPNVLKAPCHMHLLLLNRRCYFVFCQAKFVIWSDGSQCFLRIIWIFSACLQKWATISL